MRVRIGWVVFLALALFFGGWIGRALASPDVPDTVPGVINYQGYLTHSGGQAFTGPADLTFAIFDQPNGGAALWSETQSGVAVSQGYFSVLLGSVNPLDAGHFSAAARYLEVSVDMGSGAVVLPRQQFASVPYAFQANRVPWGGVTGLPAGFADGVDAGEYAQVVTVAKSGAQYTSIQAALDSIGDASDNKRYLVWIGPGEYAEQVTMKPYVDLQGSGENMTVITSAGFSANNTGTLIGASNAEARFLQVENTGGANYALGIYNANAEPRFLHVTITVSGVTAASYGIYNSAFSPVFEDVTVTVACTGGSNCTGMQNIGSSPTVKDSSLIVSTSGTGFTYGVNASGGSAVLDHVIIETSAPSSAAAGNSFGFLQQSGSPGLRDVQISVVGTNNTFGMYVVGGGTTVRHSSIRASGGAGDDTGIYYSGSAGNVFSIIDAEITSIDHTVNNPSSTATVYISSTFLNGLPVTGAGTEKCAGVIDESYTFYASTCP